MVLGVRNRAGAAQDDVCLASSVCCQYAADPLQVANIILTGEYSNAQLTEVIELGMGGCEQVDAAMRQCLRHSSAAVEA